MSQTTWPILILWDSLYSNVGHGNRYHYFTSLPYRQSFWGMDCCFCTLLDDSNLNARGMMVRMEGNGGKNTNYPVPFSLIIASKLHTNSLENFLRTCQEVHCYFSAEASWTFSFRCWTGNASALWILKDLMTIGTLIYNESLQNTLSNWATKSLSGLKVIETIPDMSIPRRIHALMGE